MLLGAFRPSYSGREVRAEQARVGCLLAKRRAAASRRLIVDGA